MALSDTDIANQALIRIGAKTIMDLSDQNETNARRLSFIYNSTREEVFRSHEWNCLRTKANLPQNTIAPAFGYNYSYTLPVDCLRLIRLNGAEEYEVEDKYKIYGREIHTDAETAKIEYVKNETDVRKYDSHLVQCIVVLLASKIAVAERQDEVLSERLRQEYKRETLPEARRIDGGERRQRPFDLGKESTWVASRRVSTNG